MKLAIDDPTVSERAYEVLRAAIVSSRFRPGDALQENGLVSEMGISRTPIRAALQRLAVEGLVTIAARRGASVRWLGYDEARDLHEVRRVIEGESAALAARRRSAKVASRLRAVVAGSSTGDGPTPRSLLINHRFHEGIADLAGNRRLAEMIRNTIDLISLWRVEALDQGLRFRGTTEEHGAILDAILDGDEATARALMQAHIDASWATSSALTKPKKTFKD